MLGVDETTGEEKQDLLSLDMNHQYKIRSPFRNMREIQMQINISCRLLSFCDKLFITEQVSTSTNACDLQVFSKMRLGYEIIINKPFFSLCIPR